MYPPVADTVPVNERLVSGILPLGAFRAKDPATAPGLTSIPWFCRVSSIAADVRLRVTAIVKEPAAATVAGTPEH